MNTKRTQEQNVLLCVPAHPAGEEGELPTPGALLLKETVEMELILKDLGLNAKATCWGVLLGHRRLGRAGAGTKARLPPEATSQGWA